ncbi:MAG: class III extradiol dioxygenase subunit B-like domain-containing protein [Candidatus Falkowbacteria bacterium]|nr:class III extradiol dioxygenase subunit B-like domain-containing protein [Candidatus Falkowbacteria bacterium]
MALTTVALLPHSPLLIPEIGRANYGFLTKTVAAYKEIKSTLKANPVDTIIIVSPHSASQADSFIINVAPEMEINLKDFGFIPPKTVLSGDAFLADQLKNALRPEFPLQLISENALDYGSAIPLYLLKDVCPEVKIIVISPADSLNLEDQWRFGERLEIVLTASKKNIALIASGDLSHRLKKKSPGGYSPKGAKFDNKLIEYLSDLATASANILKMDAKLIKDAGECGLRPLLILLGTINGLKRQPEILSYQTDFGIGYLAVNFKLWTPSQIS